MKYKHIPSLAHNLSHSFMSGMNYVDDNHVYPDVYAMARTNPGKVVSVHWIPPRTNELFAFPPRVRKSIAAYRQWLPKLIKSHKLKMEMFGNSELRCISREISVCTFAPSPWTTVAKNMCVTFGPDKQLQRSVLDRVPSHTIQRAAAELRL